MLDKQTPLSCTPSPIIYALSVVIITKKPTDASNITFSPPQKLKVKPPRDDSCNVTPGCVREAHPSDVRTLELTAAVHSGQDVEPPRCLQQTYD